MKKINSILEEIKFPEIVKVKQNFDKRKLEDVKAEIKKLLKEGNFKNKIEKGKTVAITGGSRGISHYSIIMKIIVDFVKEEGGIPFIVPAMGSHGRGDANGQKHILKNLGITEESMGCEIRSSMKVV